MREETKNLIQLMEICRNLLFCADKGDLLRNDECCGVVYAIARDCAYRMLMEAENEKKRHIDRGIWDGDKAV